ncbi:hypothetical protein PSPO01_14500 [Paraphaeosphaeria sporulosa]
MFYVVQIYMSAIGVRVNLYGTLVGVDIVLYNIAFAIGVKLLVNFDCTHRFSLQDVQYASKHMFIFVINRTLRGNIVSSEPRRGPLVGRVLAPLRPPGRLSFVIRELGFYFFVTRLGDIFLVFATSGSFLKSSSST